MVTLSLALALTAFTQQMCDAGTLSLAGGAQPYRDLGDRCEGTYTLPVAAGLKLRSIYQIFGDFNLDTSRAPLIIEWSSPVGRRVALRADGWIGREPYRMDAVASPGSQSFRWDTRVLRALSSGSRQPLTRRELGVQASTDSAGAALLLPVRIWQQNGPAPTACGPVRILLWAMSRPDSVFVEVAVDRSGALQPFVPRRELNRAPYPLNGPLTFPIPEIKDPGIYRINLSAWLGAERWNAPYLVYIADGTRLACA